MFYRGEKYYIHAARGRDWIFHVGCIVSGMSRRQVLYTSEETKVQFWPLAAYHIFHNRYIKSSVGFWKRRGIEGKAFEKKIIFKFWKKMLKTNFFSRGPYPQCLLVYRDKTDSLCIRVMKNTIYSKRSKSEFRLVWCVRYSSSTHTAHMTLVKSPISSSHCIIYYYNFLWNLRYLIEISLNFDSKYKHAYFSVWSYPVDTGTWAVL